MHLVKSMNITYIVLLSVTKCNIHVVSSKNIFSLTILTSTSNPRVNALTKSAAFCNDPMSFVSLQV